MVFLLDIISVFLLLCIHARVVDERLNLKKLVVSIILYYLSILLFIVVFKSTEFYFFWVGIDLSHFFYLVYFVYW